jgi:hypothetical protein
MLEEVPARPTASPCLETTSRGMDETTVIYSFRNRDPERLASSVGSLRKVCRNPFKCLVVDYGSNSDFASALTATCEKLNIGRIRVQTQGWPWSRAHALNIGIRAASSLFVVTTDVDMVFEDDPISEALRRYEENTVIHCRPLWVPQNGNMTEAHLGDHAQLGGFQFVEKSLFDRFGGFDERIRFWGLEDIEWNRRLTRNGIRTLWIDDRVRMYHRWHPFSYGAFDPRPLTSWYDSNYFLMERAGCFTKAQAPPQYGVLVEGSDRPILEWMRMNQAFCVAIQDNYPEQFEELLHATRKHPFIRLDLGKRFPSLKLPSLVDPSDAVHQLLEEHGVDVRARKNESVDYFYLSLPLLKSHGLVDYFLEEDLSSVFLLFSAEANLTTVAMSLGPPRQYLRNDSRGVGRFG